jgi:hypothetical protein
VTAGVVAAEAAVGLAADDSCAPASVRRVWKLI